jgi:hypothetical protein
MAKESRSWLDQANEVRSRSAVGKRAQMLWRRGNPVRAAMMSGWTYEERFAACIGDGFRKPRLRETAEATWIAPPPAKTNAAFLEVQAMRGDCESGPGTRSATLIRPS